MMNTFSKIGLMSVLMLVAISQIGCGVFYPYDDDWIVGEEVVVTEPDSYFADERITFEIRWDGYSSDLMASLITPSSNYIDDSGTEWDGCSFLGIYSETPTQKVSTFECVNPFQGTYKLQLDNLSLNPIHPDVRVIKEYFDGYDLIQQVSNQSPFIDDGDEAVLHYTF